jgi:heterodisulfide reductase subunit A-like polyferredoxin
MKIKTLVCNCKSLAEFANKPDMDTLPSEIEASDLDVDYAIVHPRLCGQGGTKVLEDVLRTAEDDPDTFVVVAACEQEAQRRLFQKTFRKAGFDQDHFVPVDIRDATNEGILERLRRKIEEEVHSRQRGH